MVPETHEIEFPTNAELRQFLSSAEFLSDTAVKLRDQYVVEVKAAEPRRETQGEQDQLIEKLVLSYTRNNAGGLKDAIDFLLLPLMARGLDGNNVKGAIPRPKSDSFEDNMPYFESKLLQRAEPPVQTESPTRTTFTGDDGGNRSIFDKLRKPGSMSSFSSFLERRKNGANSPASSLFKHASSNASKASLVSMESRDSGYRNPWNDSGIDLDHDQNGNATSLYGSTHGNGWGSFSGSANTSRPNTSSNSLSGAFESKFPFGTNGNASSSSLNTPMIPGLGMTNGVHSHNGSTAAINGDVTPKYDRAADGGYGSRPSTSGNSTGTATASSGPTSAPTAATASTTTSSGYPAPIGPPR